MMLMAGDDAYNDYDDDVTERWVCKWCVTKEKEKRMLVIQKI